MREKIQFLYVLLMVACLLCSSVPTHALDVVDSQASVNESTDNNTDEIISTSSLSSIATQKQAVTSPIKGATPEPSVVLASTANTPVLNVAPSPVVPKSDLLITGFGVSFERQVTFLQLHNTDDKIFSLNGVTIEFLYANSSTETPCQIVLEGYILPHEHLLLAPVGTQLTSQPHQGVIREFDCSVGMGDMLVNIILYQHNTVIEDVRMQFFSSTPATSQAWMRKTTGSVRTGEAKDFVVFNSAIHRLYGNDVYIPPAAVSLELVELLVNPAICAMDDVRIECRSYVKVYNLSDDSIDLAQFRMRGGTGSKADTANNTSQLTGVIAPNSYAILNQDIAGKRLALNSTAGTVWLQDKYGVKDYPSSVTPYSGAANVGNAGRSWAYNQASDEWEWGVPSPYQLENVFVSPPVAATPIVQGLKPCSATQYRHSETNRCRTLATNTLTPCRDGQYRNEATNRCRNIALAGGTLKPCKDTQYRSEETNRCRNIASTSRTLVPCKDNQYRSEETNRCRTLGAAIASPAAFAVQPIAETGTAFVGWWALGGIGMIALAYAGWEWRREAMSGLRKVGTFFSANK